VLISVATKVRIVWKIWK